MGGSRLWQRYRRKKRYKEYPEEEIKCQLCQLTITLPPSFPPTRKHSHVCLYYKIHLKYYFSTSLYYAIVHPQCAVILQKMSFLRFFVQGGSILGKSGFGDIHYAKIDLHLLINSIINTMKFEVKLVPKNL